MNYRDFVVFDFETTSQFPDTTQPVQIAAVVVHGRKLEIKPNSEFQSLIKPIFDKTECEKLNLDPLQDGAVNIHGLTQEKLEKAPSLKSVWSNFIDYVNEYNFRKTAWYAPIAVGHNVRGFDLPIVKRICCDSPWNYGPKDKEGRKPIIFNPIHIVDTLDLMFSCFENDKEVNSLSNDNLVRGHMGYSKGKAHDAMSDVIMSAELFCRTQKMMRQFVARKNFKNMFGGKQ